ncbi:RNA-directed DNA polymerase, eukaryota [Tanacetum coccineum]|uniref:RNA-directed DNA polymerase, eukaryota n=1 Tax=Tanacetum coccineum TaxID=301880 RepID=A0ABQ5FAL7_9ASTR
MEESLSKFMAESAKRHEESSNLIKEIRASTDAAIRNQGASIKALEIQIRQMSKVLQERGSVNLPSSTKINPRDNVNSISTTVDADTTPIRYDEALILMEALLPTGNKDNAIRSFMVVQNRLEILNKIHQVQKNQASEISQKAKIKWAIEGDENVKFFHGILNKKRSQSQIRGVMANGVWIDDPVKVKDEFLMHFRSRFDKPLLNRALLDLNFTNSLTNEQKEDLEQDITKEEVKRAVWDCGVDKSPGPDGFSFYFYRHFWSMIEDDVFGAVEYFFINGDIPNGCNSNFIALIPKIIDANMVLQWCRKKRKHALIFKVDFEKAYDSVRWDFLDDVLDKFGFGVKWRNWIQSCLRSSRGSILINGSPTKEFQFFRDTVDSMAEIMITISLVPRVAGTLLVAVRMMGHFRLLDSQDVRRQPVPGGEFVDKVMRKDFLHVECGVYGGLFYEECVLG